MSGSVLDRRALLWELTLTTLPEDGPWCPLHRVPKPALKVDRTAKDGVTQGSQTHPSRVRTALSFIWHRQREMPSPK